MWLTIAGVQAAAPVVIQRAVNWWMERNFELSALNLLMHNPVAFNMLVPDDDAIHIDAAAPAAREHISLILDGLVADTGI